jgi:CubicO group peptidase (beta-lactamase class C family)
MLRAPPRHRTRPAPPRLHAPPRAPPSRPRRGGAPPRGPRLRAEPARRARRVLPARRRLGAPAPRELGVDSAGLAAAIAFAVANESKAPRDLAQAHYQSFGREPFGEPTGPFTVRGAPTGIVVRRGYVVAEWGDPERVDMTFSVTKSFLSTTVGLAVDRGLIRAVTDPVHAYGAPTLALGRLGAGGGTAPTLLDPFATPHNRTITWDHLLRQTSDWEGTLWGKPEWADRPTGEPREWATRARRPAGSAYEYNDVRVNALALAALNVWRRPLPRCSPST